MNTRLVDYASLTLAALPAIALFYTAAPAPASQASQPEATAPIADAAPFPPAPPRDARG